MHLTDIELEWTKLSSSRTQVYPRTHWCTSVIKESVKLKLKKNSIVRTHSNETAGLGEFQVLTYKSGVVWLTGLLNVTWKSAVHLVY